MTRDDNPETRGGGGVQPSLQLFETSLGSAQASARLRNQRALIVGAGQRPTPDPETTIGNGRAMSALFAREGAEVICADRDAASARETADMINAAGAKGTVVEADVSDPAAIVNMFDDAERGGGPLSIVVANIGIANGRNLVTETAETWDLVMNVNLRAHMLIAQSALRRLADGGVILFVSSLASISPAGKNPAYETSKAALGALCRAVAVEGQSRGIRANALAPGLLDTPMGRAASVARPSRAARSLPFGRQGTAWEMAYTALFLVSPESSYVNAQTIFVDGGLGSGVVLMRPRE